jgi:hypothetical protein
VNPWPFVIGAYALTAFGTLALLGWSFSAMRRAERDADSIGRSR